MRIEASLAPPEIDPTTFRQGIKMQKHHILHRIGCTVFLLTIGLSLSSCVTPIVTINKEKPEFDWQAIFQDIVHNGVTISAIHGLFSFEGPVKGRAPFVVEFELEEKGMLLLNI